MQVTQTNSDGLKRQLRVVLGASEIGDRFNARIDEIKDQVQLKGFRKGKVPVTHLKKVFGRSLMAEVLQHAVEEISQKAIKERNERTALPPKIELPTDSAEIERVLSGQSDLAFDMSFEVLPEIKISDLAQLKLERLVTEPDEAAIDEAIAQLVDRNTRFEPEEGRVAAEGDKLKIDFVGKIDGVDFEGGTGQGVDLVLGQSGFIAGFEDGLKGAKSGEQRLVTASFPADYPVDTLKGKEAEFDVKVTEVAKPVKPAVEDEFAKGLGAESLGQAARDGQGADQARIRQRLAPETEARAARRVVQDARFRAAALPRRRRVRSHLEAGH